MLIGYPDRWRDYSKLVIRRDDLFGNVARAEAFEYRLGLAKLGRPVDRGRFDLQVIDVGGWSNPQLVNIGFPAAALQPPLFDLKADPAVNYGAIGAVVGHEFSHLFDDQGRKIDAHGKLRNWWKREEAATFDRKAAGLALQYDAYAPLPGTHVDGARTLGENLADLSGLEVALDAYHLALDGRDAPVIDGFSGDQRFFLGFAQMQRTVQTDERLRRQIMSDLHVPATLRTEEVRNLDAWYRSFGVAPSDRWFLGPEDRERLW